MKIIGLTGSIGMGKSEAARMIRQLGVPVFEADKTVHRLLGKHGAAVVQVAALFPDCVSEGVVDRKKLGQKIFGNETLKKQLEAMLHPLVRKAEDHFLSHVKKQRHRIAVLDIPLLFETGADARCDAVMVVSAPYHIQRQRVMKREGMTEEKFHAILKNQMPDAEKRRRADFVVHTGLGKRAALCEIVSILYETNRTRYRNHRS